MALTEWSVFVGANKDKTLQVPPAFLVAKGNTDTNLYILECDPATGNLITSSGSGSGATEATLAKLTLTQGSTTSGQSGALVQGAVTTAAPSYTTAQTSPLSLTTAGGLRTDSSSIAGATTSTGNGVVGTGVQRVAIASDNTAFSVNAIQSGTWNITNVSGTISLPTGAATEASLVKLTLAQGSTTSGQTGALVLGAVTTAAPSYTTAQSNPFSLTTSGGLRTDSSTIAGTTTSTGNGVVGAGVQRVAIASDNTAFSVNAVQSGTWTVQPGNTANTTAWKVDGSAVTQPISAASLPLPSGASTSALQTTGNTSLASIDTNLALLPLAQASTTSGQSGPLLQGAVTTAAPSYTTAKTNPLSLTTAGALRVDASATTQPISGTVTANQGGTWNITNVSGTVSLPTGASTAAKQPALGTAGTASADVITVQGIASMTALKVDGSAVVQPVSQSGTWTVQPGNTANTTAWKVDGSAVTQPVSAASLPLPSGASTSALQTTGNTSLANIDAGTPAALGQTTMSASMPVVIASDQSTLAVSGTVTATYAKTAQTASSPTAATVGTSSAQAVAANASRKGLVLTNTSVNIISLGLGATAVLNSGITLYPGGVFYMDADVFTVGAVNAIASAASSNLAIQELT